LNSDREGMLVHLCLCSFSQIEIFSGMVLHPRDSIAYFSTDLEDSCLERRKGNLINWLTAFVVFL
jgi:hypothetical protein